MCRALVYMMFLLGAAGSGKSAFSQSDPNPPILVHFQPLWENLRSDIQSAEVRFRVYYSVKPELPCDEKRLQVLADRYELARSTSRVEAFLEDLSGSSTVAVPTRVHHEDGDRTCQEFGQSTYIEDADYFMIRKDANRQIAVYFRGGSTIGIPRLEHMRKIPRSGYVPQQIIRSGATATLSSESTLSMRGQVLPVLTEYVCDWNSGIPIQLRRSVQGRLFSENRLFNLTEYAGDVTFPQCSMEVNFDHGHGTPHVQQLTLYVIDEARFNGKVSDDFFVMSKPAGMTVLDYRFPDSVKDLGVESEAVEDIRLILPAMSQPLPAIVAGEWTMRRRMFFFLNGVVLFGFSIWLWKRTVRTN